MNGPFQTTWTGHSTFQHDKTPARLGREEAPERDARPSPAIDPRLNIGEPLLERAERPAVVGGELFERRTARYVLRADVAGFDDLAAWLLLLEPAERKPLRAADVRPMLIDAASTVGSEQRARARRVRSAVREELGVVPAEDGCFDREHGQSVDAARGAARAAGEAARIRSRNGGSRLIDERMESLHPIDDVRRDRFVLVHAAVA